MKAIAFFLLFLSATYCFSQKGVDAMVSIEKKFAAYSVANGTRDAFLKFADSAGVIFRNGRPVNAIEAWNKEEKSSGKLNWRPKYAEIAASGDLGYTTGPWEFSINDTIRGRGHFVTVWHISKSGEWKFLVDLGINLGNTTCDTTAPGEKTKADMWNEGTETSLRQAEQGFIAGYQQNGKLSYDASLSDDSRLFRNGRCVAEGPEAHEFVFNSMPSKIQYTINGSGIASSGDLGYVYGTTIISGKTDNYLRIWRKTKEGWKIALEVLRY